MQILGIDIGGSGIKGALVNIETGELITERHRIQTPQPATPQNIKDTVKELIDFFDYEGMVGVGFPAVVQNGIVLSAVNIDKSWIETPINKFLSEGTGCNIVALNDADAAGIAEVSFGAAKDKNGLILLLTIGTGIGSALFINQILLANTELGHLEFSDSTIEKYASDAIRKKEELSWKKWGKRFNEALAYYERLFYPDLFIIGGGISKKIERFEEFISIKTPFAPAELLNNAGLIGAAIFAYQNK
ncbi:MAG: ROK family protein [Salinivirgaceae bacterium]|nr:ROK family protein [Salinivirgaceae bacterium]